VEEFGARQCEEARTSLTCTLHTAHSHGAVHSDLHRSQGPLCALNKLVSRFPLVPLHSAQSRANDPESTSPILGPQVRSIRP